MDGETKKCGAVSGLKTVVNAVSLARLVMERTPHIFLAFEGAEAFAREQVSPLHLGLYCGHPIIYVLNEPQSCTWSLCVSLLHFRSNLEGFVC